MAQHHLFKVWENPSPGLNDHGEGYLGVETWKKIVTVTSRYTNDSDYELITTLATSLELVHCYRGQIRWVLKWFCWPTCPEGL